LTPIHLFYILSSAKEQKNLKCPKCRSDNPDTKQFCGDCGTQLSSSSDSRPSFTETIERPILELTRGTLFADRYEIIEELGRGGMGKVYRAEDKKIKQEIAIKLIKPEIASNKKTLERFSHELKTARKIRHKNVCAMYYLGDEKGTHYITMEFVKGEDLKKLIRKMGQFSTAQVIPIMEQICEGLAEAHRQGVIHRDLKPQNIMVDEDGNAQIMDFGIARSPESNDITSRNMMIGTPEYMSPEQVEGKEIDQRSDVYSLGIVMYEMITGRVPFEGDTPFTVGVKQKSEIPKSPKEFNNQIPENLNRLILRCLEKDKDKRFQSAEELTSALKGTGEKIPAKRDVISKKDHRAPGEKKIPTGLLKKIVPIFVVSALVFAIIILWPHLFKKGSVPNKPGKSSLAVLPFVDLSPQKDQEYLGDGLADELINRLTNIGSLRIPARTSAFSFKGKGYSIQEIGEKLNVEYVLEGSLRKSEDRIRVTAQLVSVSDGYPLWSEKYEYNLKDIFILQDEISLALIDKLNLGSKEINREKILKHHAKNHEAYDFYLRGRYLWNKRTEMSLKQAIEYFNKAIEKDPEYALAFTGISDCYAQLGWYDFLPGNEAYPKARAAVERALEIDDSLAEAHASLAQLYDDYYWDFPAAEKEYKKAILLNPNYASSHHWYALLLAMMGRHKESIAEAKKAREYDPISPIIRNVLAVSYFYAGQYDNAIIEVDKLLAVEPGFLPALLSKGLACTEKGLYKEAVASLQEAIKLSEGKSNIFVALLGYTFACSGQPKEAEDILTELLALSQKEYVSPALIAAIYAVQGRNNKAFEWYENAYNIKDHWMAWIKVWPPLKDTLWTDPRYPSLLKKMGLD
jgi:serine/threonine-protein kinase